ncbi:MAG: hypothetical protein ACHP65_09260 [Legionellales bacterium]
MADTTLKKSKMTKAWELFREATAIVFWVYLVIKVAVFDIDVYIVGIYIPSFRWLLDLKLFILMAALSILWLILGNKKFSLYILFVIGYPLIMMFWKIPKLIFRNWSYTIVFTPAVYDIVTSLRAYFISYVLAMLAVVCILTSKSKVTLILSMVILLSLLAMQLLLSVKKAYKSTVFTTISKGIRVLKDKIADVSFLQAIADGAAKNTGTVEDTEKKYDAKLSIYYMFHSGVEIVTDKIRGVLRSRKMDIYLISSWFWTVAITVIIFSFEYYALYKIDINAFAAPFTPRYLSFLGFSIGKMTPSTVSPMMPASMYAASLCYAEVLSSIVILIILLFTILTTARERYREDIENIIQELHEIGGLIQAHSEKVFNLAMNDIEQALLYRNRDMVNTFRKLRGMKELSSPPKEINKEPTSGNKSSSEIIVDAEKKD